MRFQRFDTMSRSMIRLGSSGFLLMKHLKTSINNLVHATENTLNTGHRSMIIEDQFGIEINIFVSFNEREIYLILYDLYNMFAPFSGHYKFRLNYYET